MAQESTPSRSAGGPLAKRYTMAQYKKFMEVFAEIVQQEFAPDVKMRNIYLNFFGVAADFVENRIQAGQLVELVKVQHTLRLRQHCLKRLLDWKWWLLLNWAICLDLPLDDRDRTGMEIMAKRSEDRDRERALCPPEVYLQQVHHSVLQDLDQALGLVRRIKARFQERNQDYIYQAFWGNVSMHMRGEKTGDEVIHEVTAMFHIEHVDFLHEFRSFLKM